MAGVAAIRQDVPDYDLMYVASVPVAFVPARATVMFERAAEDALGVESASNLRMAAARDAARELVVGAAERIGVTDGTRRVQLARSLFSAFGEGRLSFELAGDSRRGVGQSLLHATWGPETPGFQPADHAICDAYAAGWIAAAIEIVAGRRPNTVGARESSSEAFGAERSEFELIRGDGVEPRTAPAREMMDAAYGPVHPHPSDARIASIASRLRDAIDGARVSEEGGMTLFGVPVSVRPVTYMARVAWQTADAVGAAAPAVLSTWNALQYEIGVRWVVDAFGAMMRDPSWSETAGGRPSDPETVVFQICALARATGLGRWSVTDHQPDRSLVIEVPGQHEASLRRGWFGPAAEPSDHVLRGMVAGTMMLASSTELGRRSFLVDGVAAALPTERGRWVSSQQSCLACGDESTRVVVRRADA